MTAAGFSGPGGAGLDVIDAPASPPRSGEFGATSYSGGRATVLTVRIRKGDAEALAAGKLSLEQFQQQALMNTYLGGSTQSASALWRNHADTGSMSP
jgi:hypothetical protein